MILISSPRLSIFIPSPPPPSLILSPAALLSVLCGDIPLLLQSEKLCQLIKIPACRTIAARERGPVSLTLPFTLFWGRAQAQRHRELQRPLMCTGRCWEWALRHDANVERDNRWQHSQARQSFSDSGSFHPLHLSTSCCLTSRLWSLSPVNKDLKVSDGELPLGTFYLCTWGFCIGWISWFYSYYVGVHKDTMLCYVNNNKH